MGEFSGPVDPAWQRLSTTLNSLSFFLPALAVGVMFILGIRPVSRSEGSWYLLIAGVLSLLTIGFGFTGSGMFIARDPSSPTFRELRAYTWVNWATTFSFLIVGYGFLAYRGLGSTEPSFEDALEETDGSENGY